MRITGLTLLTMDPPGACVHGDLRIEGELITGIGDLAPDAGEHELDGRGLTAVPGFVQGHVHFCQTLFRGLADDLPLLKWLEQRIWPLEAAHTPASVRASAQLSVFELLSGGTTTVQVMESVHHAEESFAVAEESGLVTILGNCLMDRPDTKAPPALRQETGAAMALAAGLAERFDGRHGRMFYALSPRFILSCTDTLLREVARLAAARGLRIHTHCAEHKDEVAVVRAATGKGNLQALHDLGLLGPRTGLAHCVHLAEDERRLLRESGAAVLHCPSTNLKLGSGIAPVADYLARGIPVAIGADGAACNNRLDALTELRLAALLQKVSAGPEALPAIQALALATRDGARALGLDHLTGSLAPGKRADVNLFRLESPHLMPGGTPEARIVYAARPSDIAFTFLGGQVVAREGVCTALGASTVAEAARRELALLMQRAGSSR
jgi:5-methylthioadenosine/S-adenosylhomocysteine deaminase